MMFVLVTAERAGSRQVYLNVARINTVARYDDTRVEIISADGTVYITSLDGFAGIEDFVSRLSEDPADVEVEV